MPKTPLKQNILMNRLKTQMPQQRRRNIAKLVGDSDLVMQPDATGPSNTAIASPKQKVFAPGSRN